MQDNIFTCNISKNQSMYLINKATTIYIFSIGAKKMSDFPTYVETHGIEFANERRKRYYQRFNIIKEGTPLWYASIILW